MADEGFGTTITFESGFFAQILDVNWEGMTRADIATSHMGTASGWMTFQPSDLKDPGGLQVTLLFDPDDAPPIDQPAETATVTHPIPAGGNSAATWACSAYMNSVGVAIPHNDRMIGTFNLKFSGIPTFTPGT